MSKRTLIKGCPYPENPLIVRKAGNESKSSKEAKYLLVIFTHMLRSNNPIARTRSTSDLPNLFSIGAAIIVSSDSKSCRVSDSCAGLRSYASN
jgi:hypothetical protein